MKINTGRGSGKVVESCPKIGETANPGKEVNAEIDQMPINVIRGMTPDWHSLSVK